jgi:RNA polymerase sigma-19 factor, ECF subfamily
MLEKNNSSHSDKDLVIGIIKGNANSFKSLYCKYYQQLINFAFYRLHSVEQSSDLVQEIFTRVWLKRKTLNKNKSIKAFIYKSLNNLIIDYYKSSSSKTESLNIKPYDNLPCANDELEEQIDIKAAVSKLPEKLNIVFTLSRYDGYSYAEIAEICEISVKAVEKRMSKSFKIIRKYFS